MSLQMKPVRRTTTLVLNCFSASAARARARAREAESPWEAPRDTRSNITASKRFRPRLVQRSTRARIRECKPKEAVEAMGPLRGRVRFKAARRDARPPGEIEKTA